MTKRRRELWLAKIKREDLKPNQYEYVRVCSDHFISGAPSKLYDIDSPDWAPSLRLGHSESSTINQCTVERYQRAAARKKRILASNDDDLGAKRSALDLHGSTSDEEQLIGASSNCGVLSGTPVQTELTGKNISDMESDINQLEKSQKEMEAECNDKVADLKCKIIELEGKVDELTLNERAFKDNNEKVLYYTGLSKWSVLKVLFDYVEPFLKKNSVLNSFQQLLLCLMKLRLGLSGQDLAYRFRIHKSTVSRVFVFTLNILYVRLKRLIIWPDRDSLLETMPMVFRKHFPKCVVIIDCFEIFLERPTNLLARAQTYSAYKHHNTVKYLIGVTPQAVSFISEGWGGRRSDKHITEHSSFLSNLVPGDTILADRGFDISDSVGSYCSTLKIPAFTKGKSQLHGIEVEQTRRIANVRIHVERVIGNIRQKYTIINSTQPIDYVQSDEQQTTLDKIVCVACALINICDSVVPFN